MERQKLAALAVFVLIISLLLGACSSSQTARGANDQMLDLDYVSTGNDAAEEEQADEPWYAWIKRAFSFGKTDDDTKAEDKPDSVADLYKKGTENLKKQMEATSEDPEEEHASDEKATTDTSKKPTVKKDDDSQKSDDDNKSQDNQNTPAQDTKQPEEPEQTGDTVTLTIRCDTAVNNGMHLESKWAGIVPASGCILDTTTFEVEDGDTVFDVLCQARDKFKLHMQYKGAGSGIYVEGINNLYEFDGGRWSGWMYCVNDWYPNYGCGVYYLQPGDVIEWNYTCDLGCDLENGDPYGYGKEWKDNHD
ncbi:MAG: DUF4430 domain-containing protein [Clostridiales bacterium]|nr:DUF4430 domain-containing protein [Clostridiales bacterium]